MKQLSDKSHRTRQWPPGLRLGLYWSLVLVTLVVIIPAAILGAGYVSGFGACFEAGATGTTGICSPLGRLVFAAVLIAVGLPLSRTWLGYLARSLNFSDENSSLPKGALGQPLPVTLRKLERTLPLAQHLLSGRIQFVNGNGRYVQCDGHILTFWSLYAVSKGWLKAGGDAVVVYQAVPFLKSLKLALAFYTTAMPEVRIVAPVVMGASVLVAAACMFTLTLFMRPLAESLIPLCGLLIVVDSLYLALAVRAKTVLRHALTSECYQGSN